MNTKIQNIFLIITITVVLGTSIISLVDKDLFSQKEILLINIVTTITFLVFSFINYLIKQKKIKDKYDK